MDVRPLASGAQAEGRAERPGGVEEGVPEGLLPGAASAHGEIETGPLRAPPSPSEAIEAFALDTTSSEAMRGVGDGEKPLKAAGEPAIASRLDAEPRAGVPTWMMRVVVVLVDRDDRRRGVDNRAAG